ncbi:MAG: hypothetical protein QXM93_07340 [Candidatus Methanomethyliaceae archaeon]
MVASQTIAKGRRMQAAANDQVQAFPANPAAENIYVSSQLKAADGGTDSAILLKTGAENADLCVAQDLHTFYMRIVDMNHHFRAYEAVVPRIKRPSAICEITSIT